MSKWRCLMAVCWLIGLVLIASPVASPAQTLRIGLADDPDILDPTLSRSYVGRIVFAALCDKLVDIGPELEIVPQLATEWRWTDANKGLILTLRHGVKFHDGEPLDAAAVKFSIERHLTMAGSNRKAEISAVTSVEVIDDHTVKLVLSAPFAPLLAQLTDRAGIIVSPKAAQAAGENFGSHPVCAGPFKFVERVAQDRIVVERFSDYWEKDKIKLDRIVYLAIPDQTVRLANLRSGGLDMIEQVAATDLDAVRQDSRLNLAAIVGLGYNGITINFANGERAKTPLGQDPRVREALELSIDRIALNGDAQTSFTKIASGFCVSGSPGSIYAPAGLTYDASIDTLYIVDTSSNSVVALANVAAIGAAGVVVNGGCNTVASPPTPAPTFTGPAAASARVVAHGAPLFTPLSATLLADGDLIVTNADVNIGAGQMPNLAIEVSPVFPGGFVGSPLQLDTSGMPGALFGIVATVATWWQCGQLIVWGKARNSTRGSGLLDQVLGVDPSTVEL